MRFYKFFIVFAFFLSSDCAAMQKKASIFEFGKAIFITSYSVGPEGGTFLVEDPASVLNGIEVEVPPGAINRSSSLALWYNDGKLLLNSGKESGLVITIKLDDNINKFNKPLKITVPFDKKINPFTIIGYSIDEKGRLHSLDTLTNKKSQGMVSFYTFKPITLTWCYIF